MATKTWRVGDVACEVHTGDALTIRVVERENAALPQLSRYTVLRQRTGDVIENYPAYLLRHLTPKEKSDESRS